MTVAYNQKIVQAYRNDAIRSVLLIDDEYLPYKKLVESKNILSEKLSELSNFDSIDIVEYKNKLAELIRLDVPIKRSNVAKEFVEFFHENKCICDVESNTESLDHEKIRKSDLVVLDYYLKPEGSDNRAELSLELISNLSDNKHMNVVVVYTNEPVNQVWLEIAATLKGTEKSTVDSFFKRDDLIQSWKENGEDWSEKWKIVISDKLLADYFKGDSDPIQAIEELQSLCLEDDIEEPVDSHVHYLLMQSATALNKNLKATTNMNIHGERGVWIQAGNIFIALCSKREQPTPVDVWNCIEESLCSWKPSFYRIVTSELQNQIEDANLSMEKSLFCSDKEQMAFLWGILQTEDKNKDRVTRELLGNVANEALNRILYNSDFISKIVRTTEEMSHQPIRYVVRNPKNETPYKEFQTKILKLASNNVVNGADINEQQQYEIAHSYNEKLSTTKHFPKYITTGSVLKDENDVWYICVTPSCNTIPNQATDRSIRELKPHRPLTLARLKKISPVYEALHNAHHSSYIYVTSLEGDSLAFSVVGMESKLPDLIKVIIMNHDSEVWENDDHKIMTTFKTKLDKSTGFTKIEQTQRKIYPIALLKPAYAARYQNIQSHYEGRIGVDFITLDLSESKESPHQVNKEIISDDY